MKSTIYVPQDENDHLLHAQWLAERIEGFNPVNVHCIAIYREGQIGVVAGFCNPHFNRIEMSWACDDRRCVTKGNILTVVGAAFQPNWPYQGITALAKKPQKAARKFLEGIGFVLEGTLRKATEDGRNLLIYGMTKRGYLQLVERYKGKEAAETFAAFSERKLEIDYGREGWYDISGTRAA